MALRLSTYSYGEARRRDEGLRIGCARYPVRGVRSEENAVRGIMDVWLPAVAPSRDLLAWVKSRDLDDAKVWADFVRRYRREMAETNAKQTIRLLAQVARHTPISLGCHCHDTAHCHRFELERLVRAAADDDLSLASEAAS